MRTLVALCLVLVTLAGCIGGEDSKTQSSMDMNGDGQVVVAVIDGGVNPYHFDLQAAHMPQHRNEDPSDDVPLDRDPSTWLAGLNTSSFASYEAMPITLSANDTDDANTLFQGDTWDVPGSSGSTVHVRYIPDTKVVGLVSFGGNPFSTTGHGVGTSSVSVGNYHGTCPECLLVFVHGTSEQANEWVLKQDWIDAQTNSWGFSLVMRDRMYAGSDTQLQREASERGQTIFFSAGNGQANTFTVPNPTLFSSQEGPDWIVTVGAITPGAGDTYTGHGKPADIAAVGSSYPSGNCNGSINCTGSFGGTSNATPVTAGMYAKSLWLARQALASSAQQSEGIIATGPAMCGSENVDCAYADGNLTAAELRTALFRMATYTGSQWVTGVGGVGFPVGHDEQNFVAQGHGSYWGLMKGPDQYNKELASIQAFLNGTTFTEQDEAQYNWFVADSKCRQSAWGSWDDGYYGATSVQSIPPSPPSDDPMYPGTAWLNYQCPLIVPAVVEAEKLRP